MPEVRGETRRSMDPEAKSALQRVDTERRLVLPFGEVSLDRFRWDNPAEDVWELDSHLIDFPISPRPRPAWAQFLCRSRERPIPLGKIMFVPAGQAVRSGAAVGQQRSLSVRIQPVVIEDLLGRTPTWSMAALMDGLRLDSTEIEWLLLKIYQEMRDPGFASEVMIDAYGRALSVALIRHFTLDRVEAPLPCAGGLAPWRFKRLVDRIEADAPAPSLQELADLCGLSVRHLSRVFKIETGRTVAAYIQEVTMTRAQTMLATSKIPVREIARSLGFASSASFSYAFRRATGLLPRDYGSREADRMLPGGRRCAGGRILREQVAKSGH